MSHRLRTFVGAVSTLSLIGVVPIGTASAVSSPDDPVFISELHYDNDGTDQGEAIEVFGPAGTDLTGWTLDLYNGNNNLRYDTDPLPASIPDIDGTGYGVVVVNYPSNGIQNGEPDGIALVDDAGTVRQFLSYEGTMTAADGPAVGLESTDIGVAESSTTPIGESLQLVGEGVCYGALAWAAPDTNTFGALGDITPDASAPCDDDPPAPPLRINEIHYDNDGTDENEAVEVAGPAGSDLTGWSLVRYNGSNGAVYGTDALSGTLDDLGDGTGVTVVTYATNGLQNGAPDGVALVAPDATVVEFVSYEGVFTAAGGPAAGMESVDIGVEETGDTATDQSLQRDGEGSWFGPVCASFGRANDPDAPVDCPDAAPVVLNASLISTAGADDPEYVELFGTPGLSLDGYSVIGIESDDQSDNGRIDHRYDLGAGDAIGDNGFFLLGNTTVASELGVTPDYEIPINALENSSITLALVETASINGTTAGEVGIVLDAVGVTDGGASDAFAFGAPVVGPDGNFLPAGVRRIVDGVDTDTSADWELLVFSPRDDPANVPTAGGGDGGGGGDPVTEAFIHDIQGSGDTVAISGDVRVEAIVTSLFERDDVLDGFFIQEEDADADTDPDTSEGIFVFCRANCPDLLAVGDLVDVTGTATEFFGMSQIDIAFGNGTSTTLSSGNPLPTATPVSLPADGSTSAEATFEPVEGMIVEFSDQLVVSEYFELARYGQLVLTETARPYQFTHDNEPSADGYAAFLADLATRRIILDDDNNDQNDAISDGADEPYPYPSGGLSIDDRFRGGDTIDDLTGVMHWSFAGQSGTDAWRIRPIDGIDYTFESVNAAPDSPDDVGGRIRAASFNVLNLFSTIDITSSNNTGFCGPSGEMDCRGADSDAELQRQQAKIAAAIVEIDAAVVGLIELENDGDDKSVSDLVDVLNSIAGAGTYAFVPTGFIGGDAIKVGLIYQPALVTPVGDYAVLDESVDPRFLDSKNRPMLVQTFEENLTGARFTAAVNHLKSKGSSCDDVGDPGLNDGQANCPETRADAARAIADYLASDPTESGDGDVLILGDLNSYAMETPITILEAAGYTDLLELFVGPDAYTYVFDGQLGYLDYALANEELVDQITGATAWHINADEIPLFDYNDDVDDEGEAPFERESDALPLYEPDPLRSSDHDPVIVGIDLDIDVATVIALTIERVDALEASGDLNGGQANALRRRLDQALRQYELGRVASTVGILTGVVDQLDEFVDDGVLSADEAAPLRDAIAIVLDTID